jgi:hypothetical protein
MLAQLGGAALMVAAPAGARHLSRQPGDREPARQRGQHERDGEFEENVEGHREDTGRLARGRSAWVHANITVDVEVEQPR